MQYINKLFIVFFIIFQVGYAQTGARTCAALQANPRAFQSCATNVPFRNQTTSNSEPIRPTCFRQPPQAPTWFFMQIKAAGSINLQIAQTSNLGNPIDVDFTVWGPFADLTNICPRLIANNQVDCGYSPEAVEQVIIPNAQIGQYYILLVDNYDQIPGQITISQIGGTGSSDCAFLSSVAIKDTSNREIVQTNYCKPATKELKAIVDVTNFTSNPSNLRFNYRWKRDGVIVATTNNSVSNTNIYTASLTGLYSVDIAAYDNGDPTINISNIPFRDGQSDDIRLNFYERPVLITAPITITQCDLVSPNNDGFTTFDLTQSYNNITNSTAGISLKYYTDAALTQLIAQPTSFTNTLATAQTIYIVGDFANPFYCPSNAATLRLLVSPTSLSSYPNMAAVCPQLNQNFAFANFEAQRQNIKNTFFPTANVNIQFYANAADASSETNPLTNSTQLSIGTMLVYTKIKSGINCSNVGTFSIEVKTPPRQNVLANVVICRNDNFLLSNKDAELLQNQSGSIAISYHLNQNDANNNSNTINKNINFVGNLGNNNLFARIENTTSLCFITIPFSIQIFANPVINTLPAPYKVCGNTVGIFNLNTQINNLVGSSGYDVFFYESLFDLNNNNPISNTQNYVSASKTIYVKAIDSSNNNCTSQTTLQLQIEIKPGSTTSPTPFLKCTTTGFDNFNLRDKEAEMAGTTNVNELTFKYYSKLTDAESKSNNFISNPSNYINALKNFERIYVLIENTDISKICFSVLFIDIYATEVPKNNLDSNPYIICADSNLNVLEKATINTKLSSTEYRFTWLNGHNAVSGNEIIGQTSPSFSTATPGLYSVKIINSSVPTDCVTIANFSTKILTTPTSLTVFPDEIIAFNETNNVTVSALPPSSEYEYQLNFGIWQSSAIIENLNPGANSIRVRNKRGCDAIEKQIIVADYKRFFTPNGDGYNDIWKIDGNDALDIYTTSIFDRFGRLLHQFSKNSNGWDGTFKGQPMPADDYWFSIIYKNKNVTSEKKGHFTLKR